MSAIHKLRLAAMTAVCLLSTLPAQAVGPTAPQEILASLGQETLGQRAGRPALAPFAHVVFCKTYPAQCAPKAGEADRIALTPRTRALMQTVNDRVNGAIRARNDRGGALGDVWSLSPKFGDCDDYAVTKRFELQKAGLPASALRLAVVRTRQGEGHAVLVVRTDAGDLVLDNLTSQIRPWRETRLTMVKLQSGSNPRLWIGFGDERLSLAD